MFQSRVRQPKPKRHRPRSTESSLMKCSSLSPFSLRSYVNAPFTSRNGRHSINDLRRCFRALVATGNPPVVPATCRLCLARQRCRLFCLAGPPIRQSIAVATVEPGASAELGETEPDDDAILDDPAEVIAGAVAGRPERTEATVVVDVPL